MEDEVMMEEVITDVNKNSSIPSEEAGDDSLDLELINPSFLFDEEKDDSTTDADRLIPSKIDGAGNVGEIQKGDSRFLAYQEDLMVIVSAEEHGNGDTRKLPDRMQHQCHVLWTTQLNFQMPRLGMYGNAEEFFNQLLVECFKFKFIMCFLGFFDLKHWVLYFRMFLLNGNHGAWVFRFMRTYYTSDRKIYFPVLKVLNSEGATSGSSRLFDESSQGATFWDVSLLQVIMEKEFGRAPRMNGSVFMRKWMYEESEFTSYLHCILLFSATHEDSFNQLFKHFYNSYMYLYSPGSWIARYGSWLTLGCTDYKKELCNSICVGSMENKCFDLYLAVGSRTNYKLRLYLWVVLGTLILVIVQQHFTCHSRVIALWFLDTVHRRRVKFCERIVGTMKMFVQLNDCEVFGMHSWQVDYGAKWNELDIILKTQLEVTILISGSSNDGHGSGKTSARASDDQGLSKIVSISDLRQHQRYLLPESTAGVNGTDCAYKEKSEADLYIQLTMFMLSIIKEGCTWRIFIHASHTKTIVPSGASISAHPDGGYIDNGLFVLENNHK
ncbi:uncharacterized protein LOC113318261 isoform X2 [Papaver somniferum]|uniref:uncharacterized protein LOC113318261 isoform X2 n=1 Tax=Papaver somniferum TaxID=3469 RepID=UPI000E6FE0B3|nr:uncharacterized protein LOC113318261 isoform X2 [Papaver somniferum]